MRLNTENFPSYAQWQIKEEIIANVNPRRIRFSLWLILLNIKSHRPYMRMTSAYILVEAHSCYTKPHLAMRCCDFYNHLAYTLVTNRYWQNMLTYTFTLHFKGTST